MVRVTTELVGVAELVVWTELVVSRELEVV